MYKTVRVQAPDGTWVEAKCKVLPPGEARGHDTWRMHGDIRSVAAKRRAAIRDAWERETEISEDIRRRAHYEDHGTLLTDDEREQYEAGVDCLAFMEPE